MQNANLLSSTAQANLDQKIQELETERNNLKGQIELKTTSIANLEQQSAFQKSHILRNEVIIEQKNQLVQNLNLVPSKLDDLRNEKTEKETQKKEWEESRNIILIGRIGNGKSTLANILVGSEDDKKFTETWKIHGTQHWQLEKFTEGDNNYGVIDTVGIGDFKQNDQQVWKGTIDAIYNANSLHRIFFVFNGRVSKEELNTLKWLGDNFGQEIFNYFTFVRTRFPEFEDEEEVKEDWKEFWKSEEGKELLSVIGRSVDNPPVGVSVDNPPLKGRNEAMNKEVRKESRKVLLKHLSTLTNQIDFEIDSPKKSDRTIDILTTRIKDLEVAKKTEEEQQIKLDELEQKLHSLQNDNNDTIEILRIIREDRARTELQRKELFKGKGEIGHQLEQIWLMLDGSEESKNILQGQLTAKEQELKRKDGELADAVSVQREAISKVEKEKLSFEEQKLLTDVSEFLNKLGASVSSLSKEEIFREWKKLFDFYWSKENKFPNLDSYFAKLLAMNGDLKKMVDNLFSIGEKVKKVEELEKLVKSMKASNEQQNQQIKQQITQLNNQISSLNQQLASKNNLQTELNKERNWWTKWISSPPLIKATNHPIINQPSIPEVKESVYASYGITVSHPYKSPKEINETVAGSVWGKKATIGQVRLIVKGVYEYWRDR